MTIGADGPIRASAISASRSGVSALAQCSHGKGLAGPGEWFAEIFGPVLGFETFATEDEAIIRANATIFGLAASIFTKDVDRAQRVARAIKAGTVRTNTWESSMTRRTPLALSTTFLPNECARMARLQP